MAMIPMNDAKLIAQHFEKNLKSPVAIDYFTQKETALDLPLQECMYCRETGELLQEVAALSDQIRLTEYDFVRDEYKAKEYGLAHIPAFILRGAAKGRVRFLGIPSGYEFSTLIEDLVDVSRGTTDLSAGAKEELSRITKDVHIQVFGTPT